MAVSRSGVLAGVLALGSVSWFHALETWPSIPPGAVASAISATTGSSASTPSAARPTFRRVRG